MSIILYFCILPLLAISACTPQEPETAATIVVQRPTFTPPPPLLSTETPTHTAIPSLSPTSVPTSTPLPTATETTTSTPAPTSTPLPTPTATPTLLGGFNYQQLPECQFPSEPIEDWMPCSLEFLPDERWVLVNYGPPICGSQYRLLINLIDLESQEIGLASMVTMLRDGNMIFRFAYCSAGEMAILDSNSGEWERLGWAGTTIWNETHTAFVEEVQHLVFPGAIWGYNVEKNHLFLPELEGNHINSQPIWTTDNTHVIYEQITPTFTGNSNFTTAPREIYRVNANTGKIQVLISDPQFHYFLCAQSCEWNDDWITVWRIPYEAREYYANASADGPGVDCVIFKRNCLGEITEWQLNWRTGELRPLE